MAQENDYFSFDDVKKELSLDEGELKRMVSEGELRAFKDADKMKFKKEDIERLKAGESTDPTVILPLDDNLLGEDFLTDSASASGTQAPTTSFDETIGIDFADSSGISDTIDVSSTSSGTSTEQLEITGEISEKKKPGGQSEDETIVTDDTTGLVTEAIPDSDTSSDMKTVEEAPAATGPAIRKVSGVSRVRTKVGSSYAKPAASRPRIVMKEKRKKHPVLTAVMVLSIIVFIILGVYFSEIIRLELEGDSKFKPLGLPADVSNIFLDTFGPEDIQAHWDEIISADDPGAPK